MDAFLILKTGWLIPGQDALYVHVHRSDLAGFVLLHPELSVFTRIHVLQQLVDRFHHLETHRHHPTSAFGYDGGPS